MEKGKWSTAEVWVLGVAMFCFMLAFIIAPVFSPGIGSARWVPLGIGVFLLLEFGNVRRRRISSTG